MRVLSVRATPRALQRRIFSMKYSCRVAFALEVVPMAIYRCISCKQEIDPNKGEASRASQNTELCKSCLDSYQGFFREARETFPSKEKNSIG